MKQPGLVCMLLLCTAVYGRVPHPYAPQAIITLAMPDAGDSTPVYLRLYRNGLHKEAPDSVYSTVMRCNTCTFRVQVPAPYGYFSIYRQTSARGNPLYLFADYLIQAGDSVTITLQPAAAEPHYTRIEFAYYAAVQQLYPWQASFTGKGAFKYHCRYNADKLLQQTSGPLLSADTSGLFSYQEHADSAFAAVYHYLQQYKSRLPLLIYTQLLTDVVSALECERLYFFQLAAAVWHHHARFYANALHSYRVLHQTKEQYCGSPLQKTVSPWYSRWKAMYYSRVSNNHYNASVYQPPLLIHTARKIRQRYTTRLADQIIALYASSSSKIAETYALRAVARQVKDAYSLQQINRQEQTGTGLTAKNFQLTDTAGNTVHLYSFGGKTVFIDFWFTGCSACSRYYKAVLAPVEEKFRADSSVVFISINVDKRAQWLKEIYTGNYTSPHCVNLNTGEAGIAHPVIKDYDVSVFPRPWLISKTGKIISSKSSDLRLKDIQALTALIEQAGTL